MSSIGRGELFSSVSSAGSVIGISKQPSAANNTAIHMEGPRPN
jgi:hypothetical protein